MASRISFLIVFITLAQLGIAQTAPSEITFTIRNAGIGVDGSFGEVSVTYKFDPQDLDNSLFKLVIPTTTINTGIKGRDKHLRKAKYFDVENYPNMTFTSTKVARAEKGYKVFGDLTMKKTTLRIEIPFNIEELEGERYFIGYFELDRRDYGIGKNHLILGDLVRVNIKVAYSEK